MPIAPIRGIISVPIPCRIYKVDIGAPLTTKDKTPMIINPQYRPRYTGTVPPLPEPPNWIIRARKALVCLQADAPESPARWTLESLLMEWDTATPVQRLGIRDDIICITEMTFMES